MKARRRIVRLSAWSLNRRSLTEKVFAFSGSIGERSGCTPVMYAHDDQPERSSIGGPEAIRGEDWARGDIDYRRCDTTGNTKKFPCTTVCYAAIDTR
jgi:hypothetical protein